MDQGGKTLALAGVDERNYAGHSFRIGGSHDGRSHGSGRLDDPNTGAVEE